MGAANVGLGSAGCRIHGGMGARLINFPVECFKSAIAAFGLSSAPRLHTPREAAREGARI